MSGTEIWDREGSERRTLHCYHKIARWGAADAEIKSHFLITQSLKILPLKPRVGQHAAMHAALTARDFFLANFYLPVLLPAFFPKPLPSFCPV